MMCAETLPWGCHRTLIADVLMVRRIDVKHIFNALAKSICSLHGLVLMACKFHIHRYPPHKLSREKPVQAPSAVHLCDGYGASNISREGDKNGI